MFMSIYVCVCVCLCNYYNLNVDFGKIEYAKSEYDKNFHKSLKTLKYEIKSNLFSFFKHFWIILSYINYSESKYLY